MSNKHLVIFFSSLICATTLGIGTRLYFSPERIRGWVQAEIDKLGPGVQIQAKEMSLSLADGAIPQIALKIVGLDIEQNDSCFRETKWHADESYVPLHLTSLIQGQFILGKLKFNELTLNIGSLLPCTPKFIKKKETPPLAQPSSRQPQSESVPAEIKKNRFQGLYVHRLVISYPTKTQYVFQLRNVNIPVWHADEPLHVEGFYSMASPTIGEDGWPSFNFKADLNNEDRQVELTGRWREGIILATITTNPAGEFSLKSQIKHLPLANFIKIYEEFDGQNVGTYPRTMWLTCSAQYNGLITEYRQAPLTLTDCLIEGDAGNWRSEKMVLDPFYGYWKEPFDIRLEKVPLKNLLGFFKIDVLGGVLNEYGQLTGMLSVEQPDTMDFAGEVSDLEIFFSNKGVRAHQRVPKLKVQIEKKQGRVSGQFTDFEFHQGRADVSLSFNFDKRFQDGYIQLQSRSVLFDPAVQELMVGNKFGPVEAYGKVKVSNGRFEIFKGDIGVESFEHPVVKSESVKLSVSYLNDQLKSSISAKKVDVATNSFLFGYVRPLLLDKISNDPWLKMDNFSVQVEGSRQRLNWKKGVISIPEEKATIGTEGLWDRDSGLNGWVSVDFPSLKLLRWEISGDLASPRILPSSQWLKELVTEKTNRKKN